MKAILLSLVLLLSFHIGGAQNLIRNGDFEQYTACPTAAAQLANANYWINPATNVFSVSGTPDYYNKCSTSSGADAPDNDYGTQQPRSSGQAYTGIVLYYTDISNTREYIEQMLTDTLKSGVCYHFEMYVSLGDLSKYTTDAIGVYFSNVELSGINNANVLPYTPQIANLAGNNFDTLAWTHVSGDFTAAGGELYMLIGNYKNDANTSNTVINASGYSFAYVYIDDVLLTSCSTGINETYENSKVIVYPNPFSNTLAVKTDIYEPSEITIYDITGRRVLQQRFSGSASLNTQNLVSGIYLYEIRSKGRIISKGKVVKE